MPVDASTLDRRRTLGPPAPPPTPAQQHVAALLGHPPMAHVPVHDAPPPPPRKPYHPAVPSHDNAARSTNIAATRQRSMHGPAAPLSLPHLQTREPLNIFGQPSPTGRLSISDQIRDARLLYGSHMPKIQQQAALNFVRGAKGDDETISRALPVAQAGIPLGEVAGSVVSALRHLDEGTRTGVIAGFPNNSVFNAASKKKLAGVYHLPPNPSDQEALRAIFNKRGSYISDVGHNLITGALHAPVGLAAGTYASAKAIEAAATGNTKPASEIYKGTMAYVTDPKEMFRRDPLTYLLAGYAGARGAGNVAGKAAGLEGGVQTITPRGLAAERVLPGGDIEEVTREVPVGRFSRNALDYGAQRLKGAAIERSGLLSRQAVKKASGRVTRLTTTERDVAIRNLVKPVLDKMHRASKTEQKAALAAHGQNVTPGELRSFYEGRIPDLEQRVRTSDDATSRAAAVRELRAVRGAARDWAGIEKKVGNEPSAAMSGLLDAYRGAVRTNERQLQAEGLLDPAVSIPREHLPRDVIVGKPAAVAPPVTSPRRVQSAPPPGETVTPTGHVVGGVYQQGPVRVRVLGPGEDGASTRFEVLSDTSGRDAFPAGQVIEHAGSAQNHVRLDGEPIGAPMSDAGVSYRVSRMEGPSTAELDPHEPLTGAEAAYYNGDHYLITADRARGGPIAKMHIALDDQNRVLHVENVQVERDFRNTTTGMKLLQHAVDEAEKRGYSITADFRNERLGQIAAKVFQRRGYTRQDEGGFTAYRPAPPAPSPPSAPSAPGPTADPVYFPHRQPTSLRASIGRLRGTPSAANRIYGHRFDENTGTLLQQGRVDITPHQALRALTEPNQALYAARHMADQRANFAIPGERGMLYDKDRLTAIKRETPVTPGASARAIVSEGLLDNPEIRGGQAVLPEGYDLLPKQIADDLRGRFASTDQPGLLSRAGLSATNAFRWWALTARPAWLVSNIIGNTAQALVAGAGPVSGYRALAKERSLRVPGTGKSLDFRLPGRDYSGVVPLNAEWQGFITRQLAPSRGILPGTGRRSPASAIREANVTNENWARRAVYLRHALPEYGKSIDALTKAKSAEERLPHVVNTVDRFLGNFSHGKYGDLAVSVPFIRWLTFITRLTLKELPQHHPGRALALHQLGLLGNAAVAQQGIVNASLEGSIPVGGRDVRTQAINPFATISQLAGFDPTGRYDTPTFSGVLGSLNPFLQAAYTTLSGHEFQSPQFAPLASQTMSGHLALGANQLASTLPAYSLLLGRPTFGEKPSGQSRLSLAFPQPKPTFLDRLFGYSVVGETPVDRRNMALKNFYLLEQNAKAKGGIR